MTGYRPGSRTLFADEFPDVTARISRLELGPPVGWPVQYRVSAPTTDEARQYAEQVATILRASGVVRNVNYDWAEKSKELRIVVDQDRVRQAGLSSEQLAQTLNRVINGSAVTQLRDSIYLVDVVARAESSERSSVEALRNLQITTPTGASVPLRELAQFQYDLDEGYVWRRGRLPTITVQAEPLPGLQPAFVHQQVAGAIEELRKSMPAGTLIETGGTVEKSAQSNAALIAQFPLMITLMLTALIVQLGSFRQMAMVISVAPLGLIGVVTALLTTSTPMGFIAILGIIALAGMIIRNSVILVDQIEHERARGIDPWNAVIDATMHRFRPIMLTAAAAILGMIPIMHDVFWGPMAYAIVGGLAVATVLTLVFLPALYVAVNGIRQKGEPNDSARAGCARDAHARTTALRGEPAMPRQHRRFLTDFFDRMPRCTPDQREITRDYADKMLLAALQEAQSVVRSYDTKAQIVGVGYILALNLVLHFGDLLPTRAPLGPLFFSVIWGERSTASPRRRPTERARTLLWTQHTSRPCPRCQAPPSALWHPSPQRGSRSIIRIKRSGSIRKPRVANGCSASSLTRHRRPMPTPWSRKAWMTQPSLFPCMPPSTGFASLRRHARSGLPRRCWTALLRHTRRLPLP